MSSASNPIFKFVSLRSSIDGLTIDPTEDITDTQAVSVLEDLEVNPAELGDAVIAHVSGIQTVSADVLINYPLTRIHVQITNLTIRSFKNLSRLMIGRDGESGEDTHKKLQ